MLGISLQKLVLKLPTWFDCGPPLSFISLYPTPSSYTAVQTEEIGEHTALPNPLTSAHVDTEYASHRYSLTVIKARVIFAALDVPPLHPLRCRFLFFNSSPCLQHSRAGRASFQPACRFLSKREGKENKSKAHSTFNIQQPEIHTQTFETPPKGDTNVFFRTEMVLLNHVMLTRHTYYYYTGGLACS